jgi:hypothetical protein
MASFNPCLRLVLLEGHVLVGWQVVGSRVRGNGVPTKKADVPGDDFSPIAIAAAVLGLVLARRQPSFDVDLAALAEILRAILGQLAEYHDAMPIGALLPPPLRSLKRG